MYTIAAIDIGSNALRLTVGEVDDTWHIKPVENIRVPVRLGQDVFQLGRLEEASISQMEEAFHRFQRVIEDSGVYTLRAVATSAMREAANGAEAAEHLCDSTGIPLRIIDSREEARLVCRAVNQAVDFKGRPALIVDIGGGSVEATLFNGQEVIFTDSFKVGSVRLLQALQAKAGSDEMPRQIVEEYAEFARKEIETAIGGLRIATFVGTGGNVDQIGRLRQPLFHATDYQVIPMAELRQMIDRLSGMTPAEIARKFQLRPDRADVILGAAILLQLFARQAKVKQIHIPNVGLKDGLMLEMVEELKGQPQLDRRGKLLESALHMGHKYHFDERHAALTAKLARELFLQLQPLHKLGEDDLLLLEVGALLHDVGHFINTIDHDKHGYYLLRVNHLIGLSHREQMIVANLVRGHRGKTGFMDESDFKSLPAADRKTILKLSAILSLADGIDVSHNGRVQDVSLRKMDGTWRLTLPEDLALEKWTVERRKALFKEAFGMPLQTGP